MTTKTEKGKGKKVVPITASPSSPEKIDAIAGRYEETAREETPNTPPPASAAPGTGATGPTVEPPKKRGRPPGSKSKQDAASETFFMRPMVRAAIQFPYAIAAARLGDHWLLSDEEAERMVDAHLALLNKYLPAYVKEHQELYTVLLMHGLALVVRASIHAQLQAKAVETETPADERASRPDTREEGKREVFSAPRPAPPGV